MPIPSQNESYSVVYDTGYADALDYIHGTSTGRLADILATYHVDAPMGDYAEGEMDALQHVMELYDTKHVHALTNFLKKN